MSLALELPLYSRYLLADRMIKRAEKAGLVPATVELRPAYGTYSDTHVQIQVRVAENFNDADATEAAMARLAEEWPELKLKYPGGTLIYLEGENSAGVKFRFFAPGNPHDKGSENL